jgi:hypothetical protein
MHKAQNAGDVVRRRGFATQCSEKRLHKNMLIYFVQALIIFSKILVFEKDFKPFIYLYNQKNKYIISQKLSP